MLASALSEVISLGAVLPFIGILTAPDKVFNNAFVKGVCESFGFTD
jgi:ATP-binding cassette, subfamily B, bacterial PglK